MTQKDYKKHHDIPDAYVGKHTKQWYNVWRALGPAGPEEHFQVYGREEAKEAVRGCWDYEITNLKGEIIKI